MAWIKMERVIINHQSGKERKSSNNLKIKELLWKDYTNKNFISKDSLILDHIIPFCISKDNSLSNFQLLNPTKNKLKTIKDFKIIKEFKKKGWIEKITNYSFELKKPPFFLKKEYIKRFNDYISQGSHSFHAMYA